jgi:hypothetical protein
MMRAWQQVRLSRFTIEDTIEQIHSAGGVAILAYPTAFEGDGGLSARIRCGGSG